MASELSNNIFWMGIGAVVASPLIIIACAFIYALFSISHSIVETMWSDDDENMHP